MVALGGDVDPTQGPHLREPVPNPEIPWQLLRNPNLEG